jgi:nitrite reductase/ring-hydroxylating ferredoxin subunit
VIFLCALAALPERQARGFTVDEISLFVLRYDGVIHAYRNSCPHLGVELNWREDEFLDLDGELLQCAMHGALFQPATGEYVAGPCHGNYLQPVTVQIENGAVYIRL